MEEDGVRLLRFQGDLVAHLEEVGEVPPSPYIKAKIPMERYQTVYARRPGSVAAPTAGLHFTPELLERLREMGVELRFLTLHVGPGTFRPVKGDPEKHEMHAEPYAIPEEVAEAVNRAKAEGRRVVAVGTTVVRALESAYREGVGVVAGEGETRLFIRPPTPSRWLTPSSPTSTCPAPPSSCWWRPSWGGSGPSGLPPGRGRGLPLLLPGGRHAHPVEREGQGLHLLPQVEGPKPAPGDRPKAVVGPGELAVDRPHGVRVPPRFTARRIPSSKSRPRAKAQRAAARVPGA